MKTRLNVSKRPSRAKFKLKKIFLSGKRVDLRMKRKQLKHKKYKNNRQTPSNVIVIILLTAEPWIKKTPKYLKMLHIIGPLNVLKWWHKLF